MSDLEQVFVSLFVLLVGGVPAGVMGCFVFASWSKGGVTAGLGMLWGFAVLVLLCGGFLIEVWQ